MSRRITESYTPALVGNFYMTFLEWFIPISLQVQGIQNKIQNYTQSIFPSGFSPYPSHFAEIWLFFTVLLNKVLPMYFFFSKMSANTENIWHSLKICGAHINSYMQNSWLHRREWRSQRKYGRFTCVWHSSNPQWIGRQGNSPVNPDHVLFCS